MASTKVPPAKAARAENIRTVLLDGEVVKRDGLLQGFNLAELTKHADESAQAVLDRVRATVPQLPGTAPAGFDEMADLINANLGSGRLSNARVSGAHLGPPASPDEISRAAANAAGPAASPSASV